jgi:hypothetical protein
MKNEKLAVLFGSCLLGATHSVWAVEGITLSGFLTAGATYSDNRVSTIDTPPASAGGLVSQDGNITNNVGFSADSRIGIQISAKVNSKIDVTGQLLARAREDNYNLKADWAFVTYHVTDPMAIRGGKVKLTTFLVSDYIEVGYAYPWIRPPQEVYSANPISTINGVDMLWRVNIGNSTFLFQPYYGASKGDQALVPQEQLLTGDKGAVQYASFNTDRMVGVNLSLGSDVYTLRGGYLQTLVTAPDFQVKEDEAKFASVGGTIDWHNIVVYGEWFTRDVAGNANAAFPDQKGYYGTFGYRFGKFLPHLTYASLQEYDHPSVDSAGIPLLQKSVTLGLRYELGTGAALKMEAQQVKPDSGTRGLLIGVPENDKAMIYSMAVDVVF